MKQQMQAANIKAIDIMTPHPIFAFLTDSVEEVAGLLWSANIRHMPIVQKDKVVGLVSDREIRSLIGDFERNSDDVSARTQLQSEVSQLVKSPPTVVNLNDDIHSIIDLMIEQKLEAVPVVYDDNKLIGIVSYIDVLKYFQKSNPTQ